MSKFNPFSVAVAATEKAIKERQKKITNQEQIEKLSVDLDHRAKLLFDIGYAEGQVEHYQGQKKKEAEKRLAELNRQQKQLENAYSKKSTDRLFQLEDEVRLLKSSLQRIKHLETQYATRWPVAGFNN